jgi:hypothetical protein
MVTMPAARSMGGGLIWVTRSRPDADGLSSAWLIRRFVDCHARFEFSPDLERIRSGAIPFHIAGAHLGRHGIACTFERLCLAFQVHNEAIVRLARIIHELQFNDGRLEARETETVARLVAGIAHARDDMVLASGMVLFEAIYLACECYEGVTNDPDSLAHSDDVAVSDRLGAAPPVTGVGATASGTVLWK